MKKIISIFTGFLLIFSSLCEDSFAQTNHVYVNGKVINFSSNSIKIDTVKEILYFSHNIKITKHIKKKHSIYEEPASLKELKINDSVTLKVSGNIVYELIIEVYKR